MKTNDNDAQDQAMNLRSNAPEVVQIFGTTFATEDRKEGMAAFSEKRKPAFKDR